MVAYDYRCRTCDSVFEVRRGMTEAAPDVRCPAGHGEVARIWSAVAVTGRSSATAVAQRPTPMSGGCCGGGCCG